MSLDLLRGGGLSSVKAAVLQIVVVSLEGFLNFSLKPYSLGHEQVTEEKCIMSPFLIHLNAKRCIWTAADTDFAVCIIGQVSYSLFFEESTCAY